MSADAPFLDLETDPAAIAAFVACENAATDAALTTPQRAQDQAIVRAILESPDALRGLTRRAGHVYTFRQTARNPRGLWLRLPEGTPPTADAPWTTVFDLDAHCAATDQVWVWAGAETSAFDPTRVMLRLSADGSDMTLSREFDLTTCAFVAGGFQIGPDKGRAVWAGRDALLWSSAADGDATNSGWQGTIRRVMRGQDPTTAPEIHRTDPAHLMVADWISREGGAEWMHCRMTMTTINKTRVTLRCGTDQEIALPNPPDTSASFNYSHCAWVAQAIGPHIPGTLVLCRHDGSGMRVLFTPEHGASVATDDVMFHGDWMIWTENRWLTPRLMALDLTQPGAAPQEIIPPVPADTLHAWPFDAQPDAGDGTLCLQVSGFLTPQQVWLFDLAKGVAGIAFRPLYAAPAQFDATGAEVHLWKATSDDGTEIPYHIVLPAGHQARSDLPVLQYGYGGYAVSLSPWYDPVLGKTWIERGGAYVQAYIRGGGELGPDWHLAAKGAGRSHAFADFKAIAADLVARGITTADRIACHGGSNGGLLCGVMLTRYPQHFGAIWASVGVYDMLRYAHFPAGKAWIDEYGDPDDPTARQWLRAYSPLHNIPARPLPPALIDTSHRDDRVDPSHSRRFVAALQAGGHKPFYHEHQGGHGGGGASHEKAAEWALGLAFLRHALRL